MQVTLEGDSFGRVVGTIEHNGAHATVTGRNLSSALADLRFALESAMAAGTGECFWYEVTGEYRWLFRREAGTLRIALLWSIGTLTGWEHRFWAEVDAGEFRDTLLTAIDACTTLEIQR